MAYGDLKVRNLIWNTGSGDNTVVLSTLATQSYVTTNFAPKASPTFTGTVTVPTASANDNTTKAASTAYVQTELGDYLTTATATSTYAPKADPAFTGTATGVNLTLSGNLVVNGTTTTINTQTLDVEDKNIVIGKVSSPSDTTADGGGWTLKASSDKTFNWVNATDAWTSSEHIHLGDNKKLLVGTGSDLQIWHDGSNSYIKDAGTGNLIIRASNQLKIQETDNGETMAVFNKDGAVELYHNDVKKIETTSGGINVTGAISVNGAALSAAPEVTGTANGSITANSAVIVNSDGTFSNPTGTGPGMGANVSTTGSGEANPSTNSTYAFKSSAYLGNGKVIIVWSDGSNSYPMYKIGTINASNNSVTFGSEQTIASEGAKRLSVSYSTGGDRVFVSWNKWNNNYIRHVIGQYSSGDSVSWGTVDQIGGTYPDQSTCYIPAKDRIALAYRNSSNNNQGILVFGTIDASAKTISWGGAQWGVGQRYNMTVSPLGSTRNMVMTMYNESSASGTGKAFVTVLSSDGNSAGAYGSSITTDLHQMVTGEWNEDKGAMVFAGINTSSSDRIQAQAVSIHETSGDPITTGTATAVDTTSGTDKAVISVYNPDTTTSSIYYGKATKYVDLTINSTTMAITLGSVQNFGTGTGTGATGINYGTGVYDTQNDRTLLFYSNQNDSGKGGASVVQHQAETNATSENFIGFSSAGYSNGNAATIKVVGNTSTQSSLTPGQKYYLQTDGSIGLTPITNSSIEAGIALSSTKLLIKG